MSTQIEAPIEKAKRLLQNEEVLVSSVGWRELVRDLLQEIEARDAEIRSARSLAEALTL